MIITSDSVSYCANKTQYDLEDQDYSKDVVDFALYLWHFLRLAIRIKHDFSVFSSVYDQTIDNFCVF